MKVPLFPLGVVLLPGTPMPLHIFEPRYRQLLSDALAGDRCFGLPFLPRGTRPDDLAAGWPLCLAEIVEHEPLEDGRSNIVVRGVRRLVLNDLIETESPYLVGICAEAEDDPAPAADLALADAELRERFARVVQAVRIIADDPDVGPDLPEDATLLPYVVAAWTDLPLETRQELLGTRDPVVRARRISEIVGAALPDLERRAAAHARSQRNGHEPR